MGLIQKKDEKEEVDGIEIIGRGKGPDGDKEEVELVEGESAENIAAGTTAAEKKDKAKAQMIEDAADEELLEGIDETEDDSEALPDDEAEDEEDGEDDDVDEAEDDDNEAEDDDNEAEDDDNEAEDDDEDDEDGDAQSGFDGGNKTKLFIALAIVLVIIAGVGGYFIGHGGIGGSQGVGSATFTEDQLDTVIASWSYEGQTYNVTAREAIEAQYSLENAQDEDGNYASPSSETIVSYIRNQILLQEAESCGISVTKSEMKEYAEDSIGTSDYEEMAESYGVTKKQAKQIVRENCTLNKLYDQVTADVSGSATMPDAPTEPEDGNTETASKEYADYIIELAGDEWDSDAGTWASTDGDYYAALGSEEFTADSATYAQAEAAYYVAYQQYYEVSTELSTVWSSFVNELYANSSVQIWGLYV